MSPKKRTLAVAGGAVLVLALAATTVVVAASSVVRGKGNSIDRVKTGWSNTHFNFTGPGPQDLPGARHSLILTAPSTLVIARFNATVACSGDPGRCHADVVVLDNRNGDALIRQMGPVGHIDSTFGNDAHEGHGIEQSATLGPGDYDFQVRLTTFGLNPNPTITFDIPQWHFTVERVV
jgi:hypothetical protein